MYQPRSRSQPMHYSMSTLTHYNIMHCTYTATAIKIQAELTHTHQLLFVHQDNYVNRQRILIQIKSVYLFPQDNNIHDLKWEEYLTEACSDHCVIPINRDKSFARFYLTQSLCLKHRSTITNLGPWLYLSNKVSTLPKLHKCPQIT